MTKTLSVIELVCGAIALPFAIIAIAAGQVTGLVALGLIGIIAFLVIDGIIGLIKKPTLPQQEAQPAK